MGRRLAAVLVTALLALTSATGCSPRTPESDTWRDSATRAVDGVHSALQSARVALGLATEGRIYQNYLQTVLVEAEAQAGSAAAKFASFQPPRSERQRYTEITTRLDDAAALLADARIAVVDEREDRYEQLRQDLKKAANGLHGLADELKHPPPSAGSAP